MPEKEAQAHRRSNRRFSWPKRREDKKTRNSRDNLAKTSHAQKGAAKNIEGQFKSLATVKSRPTMWVKVKI
jgi:hypothetical protein